MRGKPLLYNDCGATSQRYRKQIYSINYGRVLLDRTIFTRENATDNINTVSVTHMSAVSLPLSVCPRAIILNWSIKLQVGSQKRIKTD